MFTNKPVSTLDSLRTYENVKITRGVYDEITKITADGKAISTDAVMADFREALPEVFARFDSARRGEAMNLDLYGFDADQNVAVIQGRRYRMKYRNGWGNNQKSYFLVGRNETTGEAFRHPVSSAAVRGAIRVNPNDPAAVVAGAQRWMWDCTAKQLEASLAGGMRQGDVLMVRERGLPDGEDLGTSAVLAGSHRVIARRIVRNTDGRIWALDPSLKHLKAQHDHVWADREGWYSVRVADTAAAWNFAQRLGD